MKQLVLFIAFILTALSSWATHNRAGEISYEQIGPNQFKITLVTYTKIDSDADRPFIEVDWGDGNLDSLNRETGFPEVVDDDIHKNVYVGIHTYPGPGSYTVSLEDPNRNEGVNNIPNSVNVPFYIESEIFINPFLGYNHSPVLLNPPVDDACIESPYIHNPSAFDADGDSLAYKLVSPKGEDGETIDGYFSPTDVSINPISGTMTWLNPDTEGEFNFAILIEEYRNGFLIGSLVRDMQITVSKCSNHPPQIQPFQNICIEAGEIINLTIKATDPDSADVITLTASGGPISEVSGNLASFPNGIVGIDSVSGTFNWATQCPHVRLNPYQVIFKAEDNDPSVSLIDLATINITVIGPETPNVTVESTLQGLDVNWDPNPCLDVIGYKVYRKIDSTLWQHDTCETGVPSYTGFNYLSTNSGINSTSFLDSTVVEGNRYCYRIVACYPDGAESYSSIEVCAEPFELSPIPTHVDVLTTDPTSGDVYIQWNNPTDIDSLPTNGPFFYKVYQTVNGSPTLVYTSSGLNDTSCTVSSLNTTSESHSFYIELISLESGSEEIASTSEIASSVYLDILEGDEKLNLSWSDVTPWENDTFVIFKETFPGSGVFNPIDTVQSNAYTDSLLINGETYCYKIQSWGYYTASHFDVLFLNHSQIQCGIPEDKIPPCLPEIVAASNCTTKENKFAWKVDSASCLLDIQTLNIHYKSKTTDDYQVLTTIHNPRADSTFIQSNLPSVAGCYSFSAIDSSGNESKIEQEVCFDNCPYYEIPNIFTPNDDGKNDFLIPFPYQYIQSIDLTIYNRWGQQVYKTDNINIQWDGRNMFTNLKSSTGVYFYKCTVEEIRMNGNEKRVINGFIQIVN